MDAEEFQSVATELIRGTEDPDELKQKLTAMVEEHFPAKTFAAGQRMPLHLFLSVYEKKFCGGVLPALYARPVTVIAETDAGVVTLRIGSAAFDTFPFAAADTKVLPFPVIIDRGIDVALTSSAGNASGYLVGYVDEANE